RGSQQITSNISRRPPSMLTVSSGLLRPHGHSLENWRIQWQRLRTCRIAVHRYNVGGDVDVFLFGQRRRLSIRHQRADDVEQIIDGVMGGGPPRPECGAAERERALPFERRAMTRGAMLIVKVATFKSLLLAIDYRTGVGLLAVESQSAREE